MRIRVIYIASLFILGCININAQTEKITLDECQTLARENYPQIKQLNLIGLTEKYNAENVAKNYLPQVSFNAQATYQSDVTKLPIDLSNLPIQGVDLSVPSMSKDQYKATIDITQVIWDGGQINAQKDIIKATGTVEKQNLEVTLYQIKDRINQLYFGVLSADKQLEILKLYRENLKSTLDFVQAAFKNGAAMQSDIDAVQVEILKIDQKEIELASIRLATTKILSAFTNKPINSHTILAMPDKVNPDNENKRPELTLLNEQRISLDAQQKAISAKNMPQLGLFLQGGYGRPALNMLEDKFKPFAIGGLKLTWKFGNLYTKNNERRLIENNRNMINIQEETFKFNTSLQSTQALSEVTKYRELIEKDDEIISLRDRLRTIGETKYKNGVYTINDLIKDINAENESRQTKALHEIQYLLNIYNHKNINGN